MNCKIITATCFALGSSLAAAQTAYDPTPRSGWLFQPEFSIGAGYGLTTLKDEDFDEDDQAYKAFAVVKFNEFIGLEASYIKFDHSKNGNGYSFDPKGLTLALILEAPISELFSVYIKGGQLWWDADAEINVGPVNVAGDYDGDEWFWGGGVKFRLAENLDLRIEYERFDMKISRDEIDVLQTRDIGLTIDYASINLQFAF